MYVAAVVNQKGGVGKTTTAVTLAHGLALGGRRVLLVDLDGQGNVADCLGLEKRGGLEALLFGAVYLPSSSSGSREVWDGRESAGAGRDLLDVVLSDTSTEAAKLRLGGMQFRERVLRNRLAAWDDQYDVCVLDAAPGLDLLQVSALVACDGYLAPVALDHLAAVGAAAVLHSVQSLKEVGAFEGRFLGVLPTMWERRTRESDEQLRLLARMYQALVWPPVPVDVRAREAPAYGLTLWEYAPRSRAVVGVETAQGRAGGYKQVVF